MADPTTPPPESWRPWVRWGVTVALILGTWYFGGRQGPPPIADLPPVPAAAK